MVVPRAEAEWRVEHIAVFQGRKWLLQLKSVFGLQNARLREKVPLQTGVGLQTPTLLRQLQLNRHLQLFRVETLEH